MEIVILSSLLSLFVGIAGTSLTFGMALTNRVTAAITNIENLKASLDAHINTPQGSCPLHNDAAKAMADLSSKVAVNTNRLDRLEEVEHSCVK
jgi:hypothetical protein